MSGKLDRSFLCHRCGAVTPGAVIGPDGRGEGACPECGLGFSVVGTVVTVSAGAAERGDDQPPHEPDRTAQRQKSEGVLRNRQFPIYGLDARWSGARWVGGWSGSGHDVEHIELAHGDPFNEAAPLLRIGTWRPLPRLRGGLTEANAAQELAEYLWEEGSAPHDLVRPTFTSEDPTASWAEVTLSVDGRPAVFRSLAAGSFWVALGHIEESLISIEARHLAPGDARLAVIHDVEPYLAGAPA